MKDTSKLLLMKRFIVFVLGIFFAALGVGFSVRSNLGVSPVNSLANVLSRVFTFFSMGIWTIIVFAVYVLIQFILDKKISPAKLLQIPVAVLFGLFVDVSNSLVAAILPEPQSYILSLLYLLVSIILVAIGILTYISPGLVVMPAEGLLETLTKTAGKPQHICKICIDGTSMLLSVALSLAAFGELQGVREGTIIAAFGVGIAMRFVTKPLRPLLESVLKAPEKQAEEIALD